MVDYQYTSLAVLFFTGFRSDNFFLNYLIALEKVKPKKLLTHSTQLFIDMEIDNEH
tara:strand:+ start:259 stop:426 length:168 start_codon:yes stop_codon:yes gene_type:complete